MKIFRTLLTTAAVLLPMAASAASYIIPAAGTGPGVNGSQWKTEIKLHASGTQAINVDLRFHQGRFVHSQKPSPSGLPSIVLIQGSNTVTIDDVIATRFPAGITGTGALEVIVPNDKDFRRLAVTSRTYNALANGDELGQDVPALKVENAAIDGDFVILNGPSDTLRQRFNFGIYAVEGSRVTWDLLRSDGRAVASKMVVYGNGEHVQYNNGVQALFGQAAQNSDTIRAVVDSGKVMVYGSAIDPSGDPTYIPGMRTREVFDLKFIGIDVDEDGKIDIADANNDGVLDRPLDIVTSLFPASVNVVVETEFGTRVGFLEVVHSTTDAQIVFRTTTLMIGAPGDFKGKTGEVRIRARSDSSTEVFVIPIRFL